MMEVMEMRDDRLEVMEDLEQKAWFLALIGRGVRLTSISLGP